MVSVTMAPSSLRIGDVIFRN